MLVHSIHQQYSREPSRIIDKKAQAINEYVGHYNNTQTTNIFPTNIASTHFPPTHPPPHPTKHQINSFYRVEGFVQRYRKIHTASFPISPHIIISLLFIPFRFFNMKSTKRRMNVLFYW